MLLLLGQVWVFGLVCLNLNMTGGVGPPSYYIRMDYHRYICTIYTCLYIITSLPPTTTIEPYRLHCGAESELELDSFA